MQQVLVYSDSLTWGIVPTPRKRLSFVARWPGVMEIKLISASEALARYVAALPGVLALPPA